MKKQAKRILYAFRRVLQDRYAYQGLGSTVSPKATVLGKHGIKLGDNSHILQYAIVHCGHWAKAELEWDTQFTDRLTIGKNCSIQPYAYICTLGGWIEIGDNCSINPFCVIYGHGGLKIGNSVRIANGVSIVPQNHSIPAGTGPLKGVNSKGIVIEDNVWLGSRVIVLDGTKIGQGAIIGAGAVVTRDIPEGAIAVGIPAKVVRFRTNNGTQL